MGWLAVKMDMSSIPPVRSISFEEIVTGRDSTVRVTENGLIYAVRHCLNMPVGE